MVVSLLSFRVPWVIINITTNTSRAKRLDSCMRLGPIPNTCEPQIAAPAPFPLHTYRISKSRDQCRIATRGIHKSSVCSSPVAFCSAGQRRQLQRHCVEMLAISAESYTTVRRPSYVYIRPLRHGHQSPVRKLSLTGTHTQRSYINVVVGFSSAAHAISPSRLHAVIVCSAYTDILLFILVMFI